MCLSLKLVHSCAYRAGVGGRHTQVVAKYSQRMYKAIAQDVDRRVCDDSDQTRFEPQHYATIFSHVRLLWPQDVSTPLELASVAATDIAAAPGAWPSHELAQMLVACAEAELPAHRLFTAAASELSVRMKHASSCPAAGQLSHYAVSVADAEGILWAYTVMRKSYRYSTAQVAGAVTAYMLHKLQHSPEHFAPEMLAEMLWSCAAMWHVPRPLFAAARDALEKHWQGSVSADAAESLVWAFGRAGVSPPACCCNP